MTGIVNGLLIICLVKKTISNNIDMAKFIVVRLSQDGGVEVYPMKSWLRRHPEYVPEGMDATSSTSRQLLSGLKKTGWKYEETESEVRLFLPGESVNSETVSSILDTDEENGDNEGEQTFSLERQLRDFIADNISSININGKQLKLFVDQKGNDGVEYHTDIGFIDVLGIDSDGEFYVFELKRGMGSDKVVGQLTRYMGWVRNTIGSNTKTNGVIVAKQIDTKLRYAASVVPNVFLYEYSVKFFLKEASEI